MYTATVWRDRNVTPDHTFKMTNNEDGTVTLEAAGTVNQQGTPLSAEHFNNLEQGTDAAYAMALEAARLAGMAEGEARALKRVIIEATLTNTKSYPFNDSKTTVAFKENDVRRTKDYTIDVDVLECTGGAVGHVVLSDKQLNGFKVEHTGSAKSVKLAIYVHGGM